MKILVMIQDHKGCRLVRWTGAKEDETVMTFEGRVKMKRGSKAYSAAVRESLYNMKKDGTIVEVKS